MTDDAKTKAMDDCIVYFRAYTIHGGHKAPNHMQFIHVNDVKKLLKQERDAALKHAEDVMFDISDHTIEEAFRKKVAKRLRGEK